MRSFLRASCTANGAPASPLSEYLTSSYSDSIDTAMAAALSSPDAEFRIKIDSAAALNFTIDASMDLGGKTIHFSSSGGGSLNTVLITDDHTDTSQFTLVFETVAAVPANIMSAANLARSAARMPGFTVEGSGLAVGGGISMIDVSQMEALLENADAFVESLTIKALNVTSVRAHGTGFGSPANGGMNGTSYYGATGATGSNGMSPGDAGGTGASGDSPSPGGDGLVASDGASGSGVPAAVYLLNGAVVGELRCHGSAGQPGGEGGSGGVSQGGEGGGGGNGYDDSAGTNVPSDGGTGGGGGSGGTGGNGGAGGAGGAGYNGGSVTVGVGCTVTTLYRIAAGGTAGPGGAGGASYAGNGGSGGSGYSGGAAGGSGSPGGNGSTGATGSTGGVGADGTAALTNNGTVTTDA